MGRADRPQRPRQRRRAAAPPPRRGGDLTIGLTGGGAADTLDPQATVTYLDLGRAYCLYDSLAFVNVANQPVLFLAEEIEPLNNDPSTWTFRVRKGVEFHNGKTLGADDMLYSFKRVVDPKKPLEGALQLAPFDLESAKIMDPYTLRVPMKIPYGTLVQQLSLQFASTVVPVDFDPRHPVGTGPFKFKSFVAGQQSVFVRNPNYWRAPLPYVDSVTLIDFSDITSAVNAVLSGELHTTGALPSGIAKGLESNSAVQVYSAPTAGYCPITMRVDRAPFSDPRVRKAMRLLVDRPALVQAAYGGFATAGHDVFGLTDPNYNPALHREQDIAQAKSLLKAAGQDGATFQLVASDIANGAVQVCEVFAQQANAAGVKVQLSTPTIDVFFSQGYLERTFSVDFWLGSTYLSNVSQGTLFGGPYNETHFNDPTYANLYNEINKVVYDPARVRDLCYEMEHIDFNDGGMIIPCFYGNIDVHTPKLHGFYPWKQGPPISNLQIRRIVA